MCLISVVSSLVAGKDGREVAIWMSAVSGFWVPLTPWKTSTWSKKIAESIQAYRGPRSNNDNVRSGGAFEHARTSAFVTASA